MSSFHLHFVSSPNNSLAGCLLAYFSAFGGTLHNSGLVLSASTSTVVGTPHNNTNATTTTTSSSSTSASPTTAELQAFYHPSGATLHEWSDGARQLAAVDAVARGLVANVEEAQRLFSVELRQPSSAHDDEDGDGAGSAPLHHLPRYMHIHDSFELAEKSLATSMAATCGANSANTKTPYFHLIVAGDAAAYDGVVSQLQAAHMCRAAATRGEQSSSSSWMRSSPVVVLWVASISDVVHLAHALHHAVSVLLQNRAAEEQSGEAHAWEEGGWLDAFDTALLSSLVGADVRMVVV